MKYFVYLLLLYIFLPFNASIDLVTILVFFLIFSETWEFALIFSFFAGFLIDLYNPLYLGANILVFTILTQLLLYIKKYLVHGLWAIFATFIIFYLVKILIVYLALSYPTRVPPILVTTAFFLPIYLTLNKLLQGTWLRV